MGATIKKSLQRKQVKRKLVSRNNDALPVVVDGNDPQKKTLQSVLISELD